MSSFSDWPSFLAVHSVKYCFVIGIVSVLELNNWWIWFVSYHQWRCPSSRSWPCGDQRRSSAWWYSLLENIRDPCYSVTCLCATHKLYMSTESRVSVYDTVASSPMYLNGRPCFTRWVRECSTILAVHWFTLLWL